jgi:ParB family chromosome partitioning protein
MDTLDIDLMHTGRWTDPMKAAQLTTRDLMIAREMGLIETVVVRPVSGTQGEYEIIGSPKTWLLAMALQIPAVPVRTLTGVSDESLNECYAISTHWLDEARTIQKIINENKLSLAEAGRRLNKPRSEICNLMRILHIIPPVLERIRAHPLVTKGHAKALAGLEPSYQIWLLDKVIKNRLSVQKTESRARSLRLNKAVPDNDPSKKSPDITRLENRLIDHLGTKTEIDLNKQQLVINYQGNLEILEGILEKIGIKIND